MLAVTDFGCCLADRTNGLYMPYRTYDTDKGGNAALMAPEVSNVSCISISVLNSYYTNQLDIPVTLLRWLSEKNKM